MKLFNSFAACAIWFGIATVGSVVCAQDRLEKVLTDRVTITEEGFWLYNDLDAGKKAAQRSGMPMLVTFRCIPCEECVKLDEELIEADPEVQKLLEKFVRVRLVSTNGLDLTAFQFDFDQSFNVMIMNADGTLYGRYGTRSDHSEWEGDVSVRGLAKALEKALEIHADYPDLKEYLAGKQVRDVLFESPNEAPLHKGKFPVELEFNDQVVKNCIHCHMVGDAQRDYFWRQRKPIPDEYLFQFTHPKALGLIIDPSTCGSVKEVTPDSVASQAGFKTGDEIQSMNQQPIISMADIQWVFQNAQDGDVVKVEIDRDGESKVIDLELPENFRRLDQLEWRVTTWPMRAMVMGGAVAKMEAEDNVRRRLGITDDSKMALKVTHVGQYGIHGAAKRAGMQVGDVIVSYAGQDDLKRETDVIAYGVQNLKVGDKVDVVVMRNGERKTITLPVQQ